MHLDSRPRDLLPLGIVRAASHVCGIHPEDLRQDLPTQRASGGSQEEDGTPWVLMRHPMGSQRIHRCTGAGYLLIGGLWNDRGLQSLQTLLVFHLCMHFVVYALVYVVRMLLLTHVGGGNY